MIKEAKRKAIPLIISLAGTSGSGKTYSALMMAAGLAGENGKVGFLDTEMGRGSMYADDPDIIKALPDNKYYIDELAEPFAPSRYAEKINQFIKFGCDVLVIDSASHWWEGFGGCQDIAENNKLRGMPNWAKAKIQHKRLMNLLTQCPMHIIFCLRAREKSKPIKVDGKVQIVEEGLQPIQEKNFMYEMTLSMMLDDKMPGKPEITKCPKPLRHLFTGEQALITKDVGTKLKSWADGGLAVDIKLRNLQRECRDRAIQGEQALDHFLKTLSGDDKELLKLFDDNFKQEVRALAIEADKSEIEEENNNINKESEVLYGEKPL